MQHRICAWILGALVGTILAIIAVALLEGGAMRMPEGLTVEERAAYLERRAQIAEHRACCGTEHDPARGKLHGYCVVCGVAWPCDYAGDAPAAALRAEVESLKAKLEGAEAYGARAFDSSARLAARNDALKAKLAKCVGALESAPQPPFRHAAFLYMKFWDKRAVVLKEVDGG